jgi:two-component system nitrate/nitrite response regulator NarL
LIVDDHEGFRAAARALLEADGFDVVGVASDGRGALRAVAALAPGVVLLDVHLPDMDGFAVSDEIARLPRAPAAVLISSRPNGGPPQTRAGQPRTGFPHGGRAVRSRSGALS